MYTLDLEAEYDNLNLNGSTDDEPPSLIHHQFKSPAAGLLQQAVPGNHRKRYGNFLDFKELHQLLKL